MAKEWDPGQLMDLSGGYWQACALHAGIVLDIFTALGDDTLTAEAVAIRIGADIRATEMLLDALAAMDLIARSGERYANVPAGAVYLSRDSERYLGHIIKHHHHLMESWSYLDEAVKKGKPLRAPVARAEEESRRESFLMGMFNIASQLAPVLVEQIELSGRRRLLDLGGGPGTYALHFCRRNPDLTAVIFDLPTTRPFAEKNIARFGLQDRVAFLDGDFLQDRIEGTYDVAWLSHVLHGEGPEGCAKILASAARVLEPGGLVLVHEFILNDDEPGPLFPALFSLNMLLGTESGQAYTQGRISEMLEAAGFGDIRRLSLDIRGPSGVIAATRS